jgi:adenosine deaminase
MEREENIRDNIIKLPKIELHCHLDGSLSREFIEKRLGRMVQEAELSVSDDCTSLAQYLEKFDLPGQCIQDERTFSFIKTTAGRTSIRTLRYRHPLHLPVRPAQIP